MINPARYDFTIYRNASVNKILTITGLDLTQFDQVSMQLRYSLGATDTAALTLASGSEIAIFGATTVAINLTKERVNSIPLAVKPSENQVVYYDIVIGDTTAPVRYVRLFEGIIEVSPGVTLL